MQREGTYLYGNDDPAAADRLRGLEAVEDASTIAVLGQLGVAPGWHCIEVGAGAGSIARWLTEQVGAAGRVVATDTDTRLLDSSAYEVWRHNILHDELPPNAFDLAHLRHVLIHVDQSQHLSVLHALGATLKPGGALLVEESDLLSWRPLSSTPEFVCQLFNAGVATTLSIYRSRNMDPALGAQLSLLVAKAGFISLDSARRTRRVVGGSDEARFHQASARQLANSVRTSNPGEAAMLYDFAACFDDKTLRYETRATVSVSAFKSLGG
jgi:hypothetical protein